MEYSVSDLRKKGLLIKSDGAEVVDLNKFDLGVCLIKKSDGATLYATRDIAAAIDRYEKYKFHNMIYEVGNEQALHFKQVFKVLELMGMNWAKNCVHVGHGLYLDSDGKKFSTRKGKTIFMSDILEETINLAKQELKKREKISEKELSKRARIIALSAIFYGDLKNYRENSIVFDIERFLSFEGNTGPYLLYSYARAKSILKKASKVKIVSIENISESEKNIISFLAKFPETVSASLNSYSPNLIANYAYELSKKFNEFYHSNKVIGSDSEVLRIQIVESFSIVLKNALNLLGIKTLERM